MPYKDQGYKQSTNYVNPYRATSNYESSSNYPQLP